MRVKIHLSVLTFQSNLMMRAFELHALQLYTTQGALSVSAAVVSAFMSQPV